jgi:ATP-binding protein involved in chromosome partitioning
MLASDLNSYSNLKKIRYIVAVAAGKGGVGKSSVAVHLAISLKKKGYEVGVFDADIYGPSLGLMMPLNACMEQDLEGRGIRPGIAHGIKTMSMAYLRSSEETLMARAPVANGLILECAKQVCWEELDYLIIDFPPGTGDIQLTLMQTFPFSGAVLVTTPQEVAALDVKKAAKMFDQMGVPIIGIVENMAYFLNPINGEKHYVFGQEGGKKLEKDLGVPILGQIPLDPQLSRCSDKGLSLLEEAPDSLTAKQFEELGEALQKTLFVWEQKADSCLKQFVYEWKDL